MMHLIFILVILAILTGIAVFLIKKFESKKHHKRIQYDVVFIIFIAMILWTLITQLKEWVGYIPANITSVTVWARVAASSIAIIGTVFIFKYYLSSIRKQGRENDSDKGNNKS